MMIFVGVVCFAAGFGVASLFAVNAYNSGLNDGAFLERQSQREQVREVRK